MATLQRLATGPGGEQHRDRAATSLEGWVSTETEWGRAEEMRLLPHVLRPPRSPGPTPPRPDPRPGGALPCL